MGCVSQHEDVVRRVLIACSQTSPALVDQSADSSNLDRIKNYPREAIRIVHSITYDSNSTQDFITGLGVRFDVPLKGEELYDRHWWSMVRLAVCLVDEVALAEDVAQDAFAGLLRQWSSIRDPAAALGYLRTAVVNRSRSARRRRRTARRHPQLLPESSEPADHAALLSVEHELVRTALADLPPRQREVVTLRKGI